MTTLRPLIALLLGLFVLSAQAQVKQPSWRSQLTSPIDWQHMTATGTLLVSTGTALHGLDASTGKSLWRHDKLSGVSAERAEEIPRSPLIVLDDGADDARIVILNLLDGTLVFDSKAENLVQILDKQLMPRSAGLLITGFEPGKPQTTLFMYDLATGARRWRSEALFSGEHKLLTLLTTIVEVTQNLSPIHSGPMELDDGSFLLSANGKVFRMQADTGSVIWKHPFPWGSPQLYLSSAHPERLFIGSQFGGEGYTEGSQSAYDSLDLNTGESLWPEIVKFRGAFNPHLVFAPDGLIISEHTEGKGWIRMLDYTSGESRWGKKGRGFKVRGGIVDHAFTASDLVITTGFDSAWNDKGTEYLLYVLDPVNGNLRFKKPVAVRGRLRYTRPIDDGVLYVTTHELNVLDPATGELRNKPLLRSKKTIVSTHDNEALYAFSQDDGLLYRMDMASGVVNAISRDRMQLQGKDKPAALEFRDDKIVLMGQQSVAAWDFSGASLFNQHHPAPRRSALMRALLYAQATRSALASAASGVYAAGFAEASTQTSEGSLGHVVTEGLSDGYVELAEGYAGLAGDYFQAAGQRFQASASARDFVFMMVRQNDGRYGLAQVSKDDGVILSTIDLGRDKDPAYQVDDIGNLIFHQTSPKELVAYRF